LQIFHLLGFVDAADLNAFAEAFQARGISVSLGSVIFLNEWQVSETEIAKWFQNQKVRVFWLKLDTRTLWAQTSFHPHETSGFETLTTQKLAELCSTFFDLPLTDFLKEVSNPLLTARQALPVLLELTPWAGLFPEAKNLQGKSGVQKEQAPKALSEARDTLLPENLNPELELPRKIAPVALFLLAWMISDQSNPQLILKLSSPVNPPTWPEQGSVRLKAIADSWQLDLEPHPTPFSTLHALWDAWCLLEPLLPDFTLFELRSAPLNDLDEADFVPDPGAVQIYLGRVQGKLAWVTASYPALKTIRLSAALEWAEWVLLGGGLKIPAQEKAAWEAELRQENLKQAVWTEQGLVLQDLRERAFLTRRRFRSSFGDCFDLRQSRALEEKIDRDWAKIQNLSAGWFRSPALKENAEILYTGDSGRFFEADLSALDPTRSRLLWDYLQFFSEQGFQHLGDLIWEPASDIVMTVSVNSEIQAYGVCLLALQGLVVECVSRFENLAWVTTTSLDEVTSYPEWGLYRWALPEVPLSELINAHRSHCLEFSQQTQTLQRPLAKTLAELLPEIDQALGLNLKALKKIY